jgi:hypothetical protein
MRTEAEVQYGSLGLKLVILPLACIAADTAAAQQDPKDIIASQIRSQGYSCDHPKSATRDAQASKPYGAVWVLICENSTYRVTLVPNLAAKVELIDETKKDNSGQD